MTRTDSNYWKEIITADNSFTYIGSGITKHRYTKEQFLEEHLFNIPLDKLQALIRKHAPEYVV